MMNLQDNEATLEVTALPEGRVKICGWPGGEAYNAYFYLTADETREFIALLTYALNGLSP